MLYNFILEIQHDCSFSNFSQNHSEVEIQLWCNTQNDIIELRGDKNALENAITDLEEELGTIINIFPDQGHAQLVIKLCKCAEFPLDRIFVRYNCLELPPVKYLAGREIINLIVTPEDSGLILEDIRKEDPNAQVNVLKLAPLKSATTPYPFYLPLDNLRKELTSKQLNALKLAYNKGYYELPRMVFLEKLAEGMNIHRRTYEEHLRKAEKKIMGHLIPSLMF
ncbi:MAG: helix-turn-helix domain-containing protein [Candidatus Hodarchaeales archaeon]|jgi:predicted DNA binding protein